MTRPHDMSQETPPKSAPDTAERVMLCASRVFARRGYSAVRVEDVLRAAKISRATFYVHFKNKEDLFERLVDRLMREQSSYVLTLQQRFLSEERDLARTIETVVETLWAHSRDRSEVLAFFSTSFPDRAPKPNRAFFRCKRPRSTIFPA
ncbi:MAG: TetR/AcrR family transcriptional regulator [Deltaproteobacteria bacterium]|nr:TetR/AcrR family transcriptional regulator [Deltaproteobacteria bacterium]